jgi:predicted TIM-barrel fold metal-dependent hydrolase
VIDHLGLSETGLPDLLRLVEAGARVKATGFHRGDLNWLEAMKKIHSVNPEALMFGTDLPSTRAPVPFQRSDLERVFDAFPESELTRIIHTNAERLYRRTSGQLA